MEVGECNELKALFNACPGTVTDCLVLESVSLNMMEMMRHDSVLCAGH